MFTHDEHVRLPLVQLRPQRLVPQRLRLREWQFPGERRVLYRTRGEVAAAPAWTIGPGEDADERVMPIEGSECRQCELRRAGKGDAQH